MRRMRGSGGSATVVVLVVFLALTMLVALLAVVGALIAAQVRVAQAADLAALAGARQAWFGDSRACGEAQRIAAAHRAHVESCDRRGLDLQVVVVVQPPIPAFLLGGGRPDSQGQIGPALRAVARAGPPNSHGLAYDHAASGH